MSVSALFPHVHAHAHALGTRRNSSPARVVDPATRRARVATFVFFALLGFGCGSWLVCLPAIESRLHLGHVQLGWMLLATGVGSLCATQFVGRFVDVHGPARVSRVAAAGFAVLVLGPAFAATSWQFPLALFCVGLGTGSVNVAINAHAVAVQRAYGRSIISAFHATFSLGGVLAAGLGGVALGAGLRPEQYLPVAGALVLLASLAAGPRMLRPGARPDAVAEPETITAAIALHNTTTRPRRLGRVLLIGGLAAMFMISEGVASDWSSVSMADTFGAAPTVAAWAYGAFSVTMTVGRLLGDRLVGWFGPVRLIRFGALVGAAGLTTANLAPVVPVAIAGWALVGVGLCACAPQIYAAAGTMDPARAGKNLSLVVGVGNAGMLAGPALIGLATHYVPLNVALLIPVLFCLAAAAGAGLVAPAPDRRRAGTDRTVVRHVPALDAVGRSVRRGAAVLGTTTSRAARRVQSAAVTAQSLPSAASATVVFPDWPAPEAGPSRTAGAAVTGSSDETVAGHHATPEPVADIEEYVEQLLADLMPEGAGRGERELVGV